MDIHEFLIINKVPYAYAHYLLQDGQKKTILERNNIKLEELKEWQKNSTKLYSGVTWPGTKTKLTAEERKNANRCFSIFTKYWDCVVIDCDDKNINTPNELGVALGLPELFTDTMCWTKGNTKGIHIYVKKPADWQDGYEGVNKLGDGQVAIDIISQKRNIWEREGKEIYNMPQDFNFQALISKFAALKKRKNLEQQEEPDSKKMNYESKIKNQNNNIITYKDRAKCEAIVETALASRYFECISASYEEWIMIAYVLVNHRINNLQYYWLQICKQLPDNKQSSNEQRLQQLDAVIKSVNESQRKHQYNNGSLFNLMSEYLSDSAYKNLQESVVYSESELVYAYCKQEFEVDHFIHNGRLTRIDKDYQLYVYKHQDANVQYAHLKWVILKKKKGADGNEEDKAICNNFLQMYYEDENKRLIKHLVMRPDLPKDLDQEEYPNTYNLFKGFEIEKHGDIHIGEGNEEQCNFILQTIWFYLCNEDKEAYAYVLQWFAHLIFKPHEMDRFHTCLVFYSQTEGIGKSFILQDLFYKRIIGKTYGVKTSKMSEMFGEFNDLIENKIYINIEEGQRQEATKFVDVMKDNLVSDDIVIHKKGLSKYTTNNYIHVCCATNNDTVFTVGQSNRRYAIIQCKEQKMSQEMQINLKAMINNQDAVLNFVRFLRDNMDSDWNSEHYILYQQKDKELWKAQLQLQISQLDQFLLLTYETLEEDPDKPLDNIEYVSYQEPYNNEMSPCQLYALFRRVMENAGRKQDGILTHARFGRELKKIGIENIKYRKYKLDQDWVKTYLQGQKLLD